MSDEREQRAEAEAEASKKSDGEDRRLTFNFVDEEDDIEGGHKYSSMLTMVVSRRNDFKRARTSEAEC